MVDASNDDLINKKNMLSFDSISEKQEESSSTAGKNSKMKSKISNNNINNKSLRKSNDVSKDQINVNNISINRKKNSQSKNSVFSKKRKTIRIFNNLEAKDKFRTNFSRRNTNKKISLIPKRISFQQDNSQLFSNHLKDADKRGSSTKNIEGGDGAFYKSFLREKSLNVSSLSNYKLPGLTALYSNKNSIIGQTMLKSPNNILSNSEYLDQKYFSSKKAKNTVLGKRKINLKNQRSMNFSNLFEKLKESYLFEKSEIVLHRIKICYGFLGVFSFLSILLEIIDVIIFNKESEDFLNINYNISLVNDTNIHNYYFIEERKITKRENAIRIFNLIFSLFCFFLPLIIHFIKNSFDKETKKKKKKNSYYKYYNRRRRTTRLGVKDQNNNTSSSENRVKIISNDDFGTKSFVTREEIIKLVINCVISIAFYPPGINKVFVGIEDNTIYVYSLNSIFLLITFFKLINIYFAIYYLCPFNNLLYKTICSSNMVKMDFKFMFRFLLNIYPKPFIFFNFITIGIAVCLILYSFEYFSIDINGIWNNKGENGLKNFYNDIFLYFFFIIKNVHGNIRTDTNIGSIVLLIGGTLGLAINSYLIYYINNIIEFNPEEQQAYSKLVKLLNPLNNEHKASNLIKIFLLMKKMYIDNKNIEELYKSKKENNFNKIIKRNLRFRKSNKNFNSNDSDNSSSNNAENYEYKEKKKFIKYISSQFILKAKLMIECKNFKNILLIARNYSLSFNDVLKTLEDKMNGNINQLNNKLEILIQNDQKFRNFMKYQENAMVKLKKVKIYQDFLLHFLISQNNQLSVEYIKHNKEYQATFLKNLQNPTQGGKPRRMKSLINGSIFAFSRKPTKQSVEEEGEKKNKELKNSNSKVLFDTTPKKFGFKRLKSSILQNKSNINSINSLNRTRSPNFKDSRKKNKKSAKSFDYKKNKISTKRIKILKIENISTERIRKKRRSLSNKEKVVLDKWKNLIEKK